MTKLKVVLKLGKEKAILNRHHWIFSGAVAQLPTFENGALLPVYSHGGALLGTAYFNRCSTIVGRMIAFDETAPLLAIEQRLQQAFDLRQTLFDPSITNAYRLINAEGDGLPGLIIDCYNDVIVMQIATLGMEKLKSYVVKWLIDHLHPKVVYEKSESSSRQQEGLNAFSGLLFGSDLAPVEACENGLKFIIDFEHGQKTGFFCDQRQMRQQVKALSAGKSILNCFAYTGGFTVYALAGGALQVDSVELSEQAMSFVKKNININCFDTSKARFYEEDVFEFLRNNPLKYDLIILDPPAFAKKRGDIIPACRGYKDINRLALKKMPARSWLLTCSCSHFIDESLFQKVLFQASIEAGRRVRIISRHQMAQDHPINICHPESDYLKSFLLYVE